MVSSLSCLDTSDFLQAYSLLGNKVRQGELAGTDSMNYTEGHHSEAVTSVKV